MALTLALIWDLLAVVNVKWNYIKVPASLPQKRFRWLSLLLLFSFIKYSGTSAVSVTEKMGGNVIMSCESQAKEITRIDLIRLSKSLLVCEKQKCENDRVFKEGSCDVIIKDLRLSDAGKYTLRVYYTNNQTEEKGYHLHINDEISVKKGEQLKLDVLLTNADKVERNPGSGWKKIWTRGHGVSIGGVTDHDGNLTIKEFTANDTGEYRVLDSNNEALITITVTVTESVTTGELKDLPHPGREVWSLGEILSVCLVIISYIGIMSLQFLL